MQLSRRTFIASGATLASVVAVQRTEKFRPLSNGGFGCGHSPLQFEQSDPTYSIVPVVGDGKWIWTKPPDKERGYLEPRTFDLTVEIHARGKSGFANNFSAETVTPVQFEEQEILDFKVEVEGCRADVRQLDEGAAQFMMAADSIEAGQTVSAIARYRLRVFKSYFAYEKDMFPEQQAVPRAVSKNYLGNSPGIQSNSKEVRQIVKQVAANLTHPWEKAKQFHQWVFENIKGRPQDYTGVINAIRDGVGDCEERAGVFIALCRACEIPARLVWVPNHSWAEILLIDTDGESHWIPCHTATYSWFGWTGAHEIVLQKGDRIFLPDKRKHVRLLADHYRCTGARPNVFFTANLTPTGQDAADPGPGGREKNEQGQWKIVGDHPDNKYMRE